ncbi:MAG: hypothetical protein BZY88_13785 [SAR202 cluster bacterium Io17-Chloro-G9]|nr:MAG: hypothetical protein BZY88_13785 [SAR202 cluster bacterium Io17-Chloro-G9]
MLGVFGRLFNRGEVDCDDVRRMSSDYIEEQLPPKKFASVRSHLAGCGPCRAFVETLATTIGLLARLPRVSPQSSFRDGLNERIRRQR